MKLTCAIGAMTFYPASSMMSVTREAGFPAVELLLTPAILRRGTEYYTALAAINDLSISSVHARLHFRDVSLSEKTESDRASIRFAAQIDDCTCVVLHPPVSRSGDLSGVWRWLDAICTERDIVRRDLHLAIENRAENHDGTVRQQIDNLDRLRIVASEWGVHITLDIAHAASFGIDPLVAIDTVGARLVNVHLSDAKDRRYRGGVLNGLLRDHHVPGDGVLDMTGILDRLRQREYDGMLTLELSPLSLRAYWPWAPARILNDTRTRLMHHEIGGERDASADASPQRQIR